MEPNEDFFMHFTFQGELSLKLPNPIILNSYEVAVKFISIPNTFYNVPDTLFDVRVDGGAKVRHTVPAGHYSSIETIVSKINTLIDTDDIEMHYDSALQAVQVRIAGKRSTIQFARELATFFRLPTNAIRQTMHSAHPVSFSGSKQCFFVATNFTAPQVCNNRLVRILCAVLTTDGESVTNHGTYIPVENGVLNDINISILRHNAKDKAKFLSGAVTVTLHFRHRHK